MDVHGSHGPMQREGRRRLRVFATLALVFLPARGVVAGDPVPKIIAFPRPDLRTEILLSWLDGRGDEDPHKAWEMQVHAGEALLARGELAVGPLIRRMARGDLMTRIQSIRLLAQLGQEGLGEAFRRHLAAARNPHERLALVQSLGQLRHGPARPALIAFLEEAKDPTTRAVAIHALGRVGRTEDARLLLPYLDDDGLALEVFMALEALEAKDAFDRLMLTVASRRPMRVRQAALVSAARLGGRRALPLLGRLWTDGEFPTAVVLDALGSTGALGALPYLLGALRGQLPPERLALGEKLGDVAMAAAAALGRTGQRHAVLSLSTWLRKRQDVHGRMIGLASLYRLTGEESYLDTLDRLAGKNLSSDAHRALLQSIAALGETEAGRRVARAHEGCAADGTCNHDHGSGGAASWIEMRMAEALRKAGGSR